MTSSLDVLSILANKEHYERFSPFIQEHLVGPESWVIIKDMGAYFEKHTNFTWATFATFFLMVKHPMYKPDKVDTFRTIFEALDNHEPDEDLLDELTEHFISKDYATKVGEAALSIVEGNDSYGMEDITSLMSEFDLELDRAQEMESFFVEEDDDLLMEEFERKGGLKWKLSALDEAVGNILKGDFIMFAAGVGAGKTTMLVNEACHMADQLPDDEYVVWFLNEERGQKLRSRISQSATGMTKQEIIDDPAKFMALWKGSNARNKIKIYDRGLMFTNDMERVLKKYKAGLIIVDQLWKCKMPGKSSEGEVTRVGLVFNWGREMAKIHAPLITVHQADATAVGQMWIEQNQLHMSKIGVQGEMDAIITLGRSLDPSMATTRGLYTPKNKISGNETFRSYVTLDAERATYTTSTDEVII